MNNHNDLTSIPHLNPDFAWNLWQQLNNAADALWDIYEQEFLQFCIDESDQHPPEPPLPFENDPFPKAA